MSTNSESFTNPREYLTSIKTDTDFLEVSGAGGLLVEACSAVELIAKFGSPLYVVSERALRSNYRRIRNAFDKYWEGEVNVLYAIKANNNLAIRAIMAEEGAGGDCFGESELYATFAGGADPKKVVMNGSSKSEEEIRCAAELKVRINVDAEDEIEVIRKVSKHIDSEIRVNLRIKLAPQALDSFGSDYFGIPSGSGVQDFLAHEKWGFSPERGVELIKELQATPGIILDGYNIHMGRLARDPEVYAIWAEDLGRKVRELHDATGFWPRLLDIGGGWARERDPESRRFDLNPHKVESYAKEVCSALRIECDKVSKPIPELWLEPGRYIAGNAVTLLTSVGSIKRDLGQTWVHVDSSTNNLMRIDTSKSYHHIIAACEMDRPHSLNATIVGPTCVHSVLGVDRQLPDVGRDEIFAILDAGMYAETTSTQFNGVPRPATVLVKGTSAELIKERETINDVFHKHRIPERLRINKN